MFLKHIAVDEHFVVTRLDDDTYWDGSKFTGNIDFAKQFQASWDAVCEIGDIYRKSCEGNPKRTFIVPVTVDVSGEATREQISQYLEDAVKLFVDRKKHGNGPTPDSYVDLVVHFHLIKDLPDVLDEDPDNPELSWGYRPDIDNL